MNVLKEGDNIMRMSARTVCLRRMIRAALILLCIICAFTGCNPGKNPDGNEPVNSGVPGTETTPGGTDNESVGAIILSESAQAYREMFDLMKLPVAENADQDGIRTAVDIDRSMGEEAYKIDVAGGELKITASGDTGIFRALSRIYTLYEDGALPEVHLDEAPDTGLRGVIEGFYGVAWTHQFRLDLMEFMGRSRLNTYIYAPKDDAKHRAKWRVLYTQEELAKLESEARVLEHSQLAVVFSCEIKDVNSLVTKEHDTLMRLRSQGITDDMLEALANGEISINTNSEEDTNESKIF